MTPAKMEKLVLARCRLVAKKYGVTFRTGDFGVTLSRGKFVLEDKLGVCALGACAIGSEIKKWPNPSPGQIDFLRWKWVEKTFGISNSESADFAMGFDDGKLSKDGIACDGDTCTPYYNAGARVRMALVAEGLMR